MKKFFKIVIIIFLVYIIINNFNNDINKENKRIENITNNIEILETKKETKDNYNYFINGKIKNNNQKEIRQINITFELYNKENIIIGYTYDMKEYIKPNEIIEISGIINGFEIDGEDVDHWKITISSI